MSVLDFQLHTRGQKIGIAVLVLSSGFGALSMAGFDNLPRFALSTYLIVAAVGGAVGGSMLATQHRTAGALAGIIAGLLGLTGVYFYVQHRHSVYHIELVLVQMAASAPAIGAYVLLKKIVPQ